MKRLLLATLFAGAAVSVAFVLRPGPLAGQAPSSAAVAGAPCCENGVCHDKNCCSAAPKPKGDAAVVAELVKILDRTKSTDTFVATMVALSQFEDKSSLPAVVRNASRLGLLKGMCSEHEPSKLQAMILDYLSGEMVAECRHTVRPNYGPTPLGYYPPCVPPMPMNFVPPACPQISTFAPAPPPVPCIQMPVSAPCHTTPAVTPEHIAAPKECKPVSAAPAVNDAANAQIISFGLGFSR